MNSKFKTITGYFRVVCVAVTTMGMMAIPSVTNAMDWYGGLSVGRARHEATVGDLLGSSFQPGSIDGDNAGWKAFAGMVLWDKYVGAEFGYVNLGEANAESGSATATSRAKGFTAALAGLIPFTDKFGLLLKIGAFGSQVRLSAGGPGAPASQSASDLNPFGGMGVQYDFSKNFGARFEVERYNAGSLGSPYINLISAGVVYRFGK
ncbi:MAG: outer membrane beta-barrel protein [Bacteroidota bacterium]